MIDNKDTLEETQEILINVIESFKEMNEDNIEERLKFVKKALIHLDDNVLKDNAFKGSDGAINELLKKIKRNINALSYAVVVFTAKDNIEKKRDMVTSWLTYYVKQINTHLGNGNGQ